MKKLLAVGMLAAFAVPASAATLSLSYANGPAALAEADISGGAVTIGVEVRFDFSDATDATTGLNAVSFNLTAAPESAAGGLQGDLVADPMLTMSDNATALTNWSASDVPGLVGGLSQFSVFGNLAADSIFTAGTVVIGTFNITVDAGSPLGLRDFYIQRNNTFLTPTVADSFGTSYAFNLSGDGYDGKYSIGNGFAGKGNGAGAIPMQIDVTPEPASLALLALGGIAVLRRRS